MIIQKYFFSCLNGNQFTTNQFYLHFVLFWDCVIVEHFCIVAVLQDVLCNPLPLGSITSLCCHTCHYSVQNNQINLEPLIRIIIFSCPRSRSVRIYKMKSALSGGVVRISLWRGAQLSVRDFTALHAEKSSTFCLRKVSRRFTNVSYLRQRIESSYEIMKQLMYRRLHWAQKCC